MKSCTICGQAKHLAEFSVRQNSAYRGGIVSWCKACTRENSRQRYRAARTNEPRVYADPTKPKACPRCKQTKPPEAFPQRRNKRRLGGEKLALDTYCLDCRKVEHAEPRRKTGSLRRVYGITLADKEGQIAAQAGVCAICNKALVSLGTRNVHVDHCHATGKLRGVLCAGCNHILGRVKDNTEVLQRAIDYLRSGGVWQMAPGKLHRGQIEHDRASANRSL